MTLIELSTTLEKMPVAGFASGLAAVVYLCGPRILKGVFSKRASNVTSRQVCHYFMDRGYVVYEVEPIANTYNWSVELIEDGKSVHVTVYTDGNTILDHEYKNLLPEFN